MQRCNTRAGACHSRRYLTLGSLHRRTPGCNRCRRVRSNSNPGYPCRVSLQDAEVGEELLLVSFQHQPFASPYRASGPIYVRRGAARRVLEPNQLTDCITRCLISVRGYNAVHMLLQAEICRGGQVAAEIGRQFDDARIAYLHLHNAKPGCFSCRVERA